MNGWTRPLRWRLSKLEVGEVNRLFESVAAALDDLYQRISGTARFQSEPIEFSMPSDIGPFDSITMNQSGWIGLDAASSRFEFTDSSTAYLRDANLMMDSGRWIGLGATEARLQFDTDQAYLRAANLRIEGGKWIGMGESAAKFTFYTMGNNYIVDFYGNLLAQWIIAQNAPPDWTSPTSMWPNAGLKNYPLQAYSAFIYGGVLRALNTGDYIALPAHVSTYDGLKIYMYYGRLIPPCYEPTDTTDNDLSTPSLWVIDDNYENNWEPYYTASPCIFLRVNDYIYRWHPDARYHIT